MGTSKTRSCNCNNFKPGRPLRKGVECERCWRYHQDLTFHRLHGGTGNWSGNTIVEGAPPPTPPPPCRHLGGPTGELVECPTCTGKVQLRVRACAVHGRCTPLKSVEGLTCCAGCPDRSPHSEGAMAGERDPAGPTIENG